MRRDLQHSTGPSLNIQTHGFLTDISTFWGNKNLLVVCLFFFREGRIEKKNNYSSCFWGPLKIRHMHGLPLYPIQNCNFANRWIFQSSIFEEAKLLKLLLLDGGRAVFWEHGTKLGNTEFMVNVPHDFQGWIKTTFFSPWRWFCKTISSITQMPF